MKRQTVEETSEMLRPENQRARDLITAERTRQQREEGFDAVHDDKWDDAELLRAGFLYYLNATGRLPAVEQNGRVVGWPWDAKWWKPKDPVKDLVRAGALFIAEQDRLIRLGRSTAHVRQKYDFVVEALERELGNAAKPRTFVPDALEKLASLYRERGAVYGDNYLHAGEALSALFPRGITLRTAEDFGRFHLIVHLESKLSRYCAAVEKTGKGHVDSLDDLSVYAQMLQEFDHDPR